MVIHGELRTEVGTISVAHRQVCIDFTEADSWRSAEIYTEAGVICVSTRCTEEHAGAPMVVITAEAGRVPPLARKKPEGRWDMLISVGGRAEIRLVKQPPDGSPS